MFTCTFFLIFFIQPKGHHLRAPKQQDGPVLQPPRGQGGRGQAGSPGGVHLRRGLGIWGPVHLLSAGQADGWGAGCHCGVPRLRHLPKGKATEPFHYIEWASKREECEGACQRPNIGQMLEQGLKPMNAKVFPHLCQIQCVDYLFTLWRCMRLTLYLSVFNIVFCCYLHQGRLVK